MIKALKKIRGKRGYGFLAINLIGFLMLLFIADAAVGGVLKFFFWKQSSGWDYRTKYAMEDSKAAVVILGASRAQHCYHPEVFEKQLNLSCFNAGRDGQSILYSYAVFKSILKRYTPKIVILDCEEDLFGINTYSYERTACLLPYYDSHPEIQTILETRSPFEKLKLYSKIYPYNSMLFNIVAGNAEFNKKRHQDINGYLPLENELNEPVRNVVYNKPYPTDTTKVNILTSLIADCKKANIQLYLVCSPYFSNITGAETSLALTKNTARENKLPYMDFINDSFFLNRSNLFDDTAHVNDTGAKIFSARVVAGIKQ